MTAPAAPAIDEVRVAPMRLADRTAKTFLIGRHGDDVNMIGHQAIGPYLDMPTPGLLGEKIAVDLLVTVLEEDRFAAIATLGDVVRRVADDNAAQASHAKD